MDRLSDAQRHEWMNGTRKQAAAVQALVTAGQVQCDTCEAPAVAIGHQGEGTPVRVECGACFLARLNADRATRPTRDQLVARANAAVGLA